MQEFCPLCAKNSVKSKIKAYQLNLEEAVFMCSSDTCIWPAGCQDLTFISRPIGKDYSKNWDEAAAKHIKSEPDPLLELSAYTPPQTPGTELTSKDASVTNSAIQSSTTTVPDKVSSSKSTVVEKIEPNDFDDLDMVLNCTFDEDIEIDEDLDCKVLEPKLDFKPGKLEKESIQDSVFIKQCDRSIAHGKKSVQVNCKNETITSKTTSLVSKIEVKDEKPCISTDSRIRERLRLGRKYLKRKSENVNKLEKFDFDDLLKSKSKIIKEEKCKIEPIKIEISEFENKEIKLDKGNANSEKIIKVLKIENALLDCNLDKVLSETSTNVNNINNIELSNYNERVIKCSNKDQIDFDSILGLTSSSKDSGVDQDIGNSNVDMDLEELLAGFSDDLTSTMSYNTHNYNYKTPIEDTDENKWINSLFE